MPAMIGLASASRRGGAAGARAGIGDGSVAPVVCMAVRWPRLGERGHHAKCAPRGLGLLAAAILSVWRSAVDVSAVASLFARFDREIWLLTSQADGRRGGLIATFVNQASIVPEMPRVLVGLAKQHYTWELVQASGVFALHLLGQRHLDWVYCFGLSSGRQGDKFAG